jgi:hypothetical protein
MALRILLTLVLTTTYCVNSPLDAAEPQVSFETIRAAITKALPMLEAGSVRSANERQCFTCHSQALPTFALREAIERGFKVDLQNVERQLKHTHEHLKRGVENYRQAKGQGGGVLTAGYALLTLEEGHWPDDETTAAVTHYLVEYQKENRHWSQRGTRPPTSGSDFTATYVALRGLSYFGTEDQRVRIADRRAVVAKWLSDQLPTDTEDHVFRLLSLPYVDAGAARIDAATKELFSQQRTDGGWGQTSEMASDAYATGTVLVALLRAGKLEPSHLGIQSGVSYLLKNQLDDGTWHVATRAQPIQDYFESGFPHGVDQFISISATSWSTLALLLALPIKPSEL